MALKILMLRKKLTDHKKREKELREKLAALKKREADLEKDIDAAATDEEKAAVEEAVTEFETEKADTETALEEATQAIEDLSAQIDELEDAAQQAAGSITGEEPPADDGGDDETRGRNINKRGRKRMSARMETYETIRGIRVQTLRSKLERDDVKDFVHRMRELHDQKRAVKGSELGVPETLLPILRDTTEKYSKLYQYINITPLKGKARQNIAGEVPEGVWTEMIASLNALDIDFHQLEMDGYKVGGYVVVPNSTLEDDDNLELLATILDYLGQSIGKAVDKTIPYGDGAKKPVGYITRLAASVKPAWWGNDQGDFTDLHTSNVIKLDLLAKNGAEFFRPLIGALGKAKPNYSNGELVWIMNRTTHIDLMSRAMAWDSSAVLLAGMNNTMPVIGGVIVEMDYMADYDIAGGFMDLNRWVERSEANVAYSDIPLFIDDCTVFKATQRFDGKPVRGEGFVIVNYNNTNPITSLSFAPDYNGTAAALVVTAPTPASGTSTVTVSGATGVKQMYMVSGVPVNIPKGAELGDSWTAVPSTKKIPAVTGNYITICDLDAHGRVIGVGAGQVG